MAISKKHRLSKTQIIGGMVVGLAVGSLIPDKFNLLSIFKIIGKKSA